MRWLMPRGDYRYTLSLTVTQKFKEPLEVLRGMWGGQILCHTRRPNEIFSWAVAGPKAERALTDMLPFMRLKTDQAEESIAFQARRLRGADRKDVAKAAAQRAMDEASYQLITAMKRK